MTYRLGPDGGEERGERRIFTLDSDFRIYRIHGRTRFDIIPS